MNGTTSQTVDQVTKGGLAAFINYLLVKAGMDPELVVIIFPSILIVLAWLSTKIGDPQIASFLGLRSDSSASEATEATPDA